MKCPNCGIELRADDKICFVCGTPVTPPAPSERADKTNQYQPRIPAPEQVQSFSRAYSGTVPREGYYPPAANFSPDDGFNSYSESPQSGLPYQEPQKKKKSRKPLVISIIALLLVAAIVTGVIIFVSSNTVSEAELREAKENYLPPAQAVQIDLTKADPSNSQIKFTYDDRARITSCVYSVNNKKYNQTYDYNDAARVVTITVDYKDHHILTQDIGYDKVQKPNEFEVVDGQYLRLDEQSLNQVTPMPTDPPTTDAPAPTDAPTKAPTETPTEEPTEVPTNDFRQLYIDFLGSTDLEFTHGNLVYLNDDDIPELLLFKNLPGSKIYICWIDGGEVQNDFIYGQEANSFYDRIGYIVTRVAHLQYGGWNRYFFDGSSVYKVQSAGWQVDSPQDGVNSTKTYLIDGEEVSEDEYNAASTELDGYTSVGFRDAPVEKDSLEDYIRNFAS